jgi:hypothetical protein
VRELAEKLLSVSRGLLRMVTATARRVPAVRNLDDAGRFLPADDAFDVEARAANHEYDANMDRDRAERMALSGYVRRGRT